MGPSLESPSGGRVRYLRCVMIQDMGEITSLVMFDGAMAPYLVL